MAGQYLVLNPRRRRRRKHATRRHRASTRRRRRRRNPISYMLNPRRRRRRSFRRARRTHRRSNPGLGRLGLGGLDLMGAAFGAAGYIGTNVAAGYVSGMLPAQFQSGWGKTAVKAGIVIAAPLLLRRFIGGKNAKMLALGGGVAVVVDIIHTLAPSIPGLSALQLTGYEGASQFGLGDAYGDVDELSGAGEAYFDE